MPKNLLRGGGAASPVERELAETLRDAKAASVVRALTPAPADPLTSLNTALDVLTKFRTATEAPAKELDDVEKALKRAADAIAVKSLDPASAAPAPASGQEMVEMARSAVEIHRTAAQTALEQEAAERERRQEAEATVGQAAASAREDEASKWSAMIAIQKDNNQTVLTMMEQMFGQQLTAQQQSFQQTLAAINEKLDLKTAVAQAESEARERLHAAELTQREKEAQWALERLKFEHELQAAPRAATPQDALNQIWAQAEGKKLLVSAEDFEAEAKAKRERAEIGNDILDSVRENIGPVLRGLANLGGASQGAPRNGIPATPPPPPAAGVGA